MYQNSFLNISQHLGLAKSFVLNRDHQLGLLGQVNLTCRARKGRRRISCMGRGGGAVCVTVTEPTLSSLNLLPLSVSDRDC